MATDPVSERVAELAKTHTLSPARREGADLALRDAFTRGEWPSAALEISVDDPVIGAGPLAARVVEALRALRVDVTGEMDRAIQGALR